MWAEIKPFLSNGNVRNRELRARTRLFWHYWSKSHSVFWYPWLFSLFPPCIYHDIFEGVFTIIFKFSLQYIIDKKLITFREFQNKTQSLNLRNKDKKNFPLISFERLDQIRFIASESFTMARFYLHLIDFLDADDEIFCIVQLLVKIINILMLFDFKLEHLIILENLITSFLSLCSNQSGINMTVKFHHMIHYSRLIEKFGPPRIYSTINFESMNSIMKQQMANSKNWKNSILKTLNKYARLSLVESQSKCTEVGVFISTIFIPSELSEFSGKSKIKQMRGLNWNNQISRSETTAIIANLIGE